MNQSRSSCTTLIVGKKASIDGTLMIARNEDHHDTIDPKIFTVQAESLQKKSYLSFRSHECNCQFAGKSAACYLRAAS